jgi:hypothetical protein
VDQPSFFGTPLASTSKIISTTIDILAKRFKMDMRNEMPTHNSLIKLLDGDDAAVLAIEIDPRIEFNASKRAIVNQRVAGCGLADTDIDDIVGSALASLHAAASAALRSLDVSKLDAELIAFDGDLLSRIGARQAEKREQSSFARQIERFRARNEFRSHAYGPAEISNLASLCADGDVIVAVDFDEIVIERDGIQRVITRRDMIEATMPGTSSVESWRKAGGFVSESKIKKARERAEKAKWNAEHPDSGRAIIHPDGSVTRA